MCEITIKTPVIGISSDPLSIKITGTVIDCAADIDGNQVIVEVACEFESVPFAEVSANVSGQDWDVTVTVPSSENCLCGSSVFITARCARDINCTTPLQQEFELRCPKCPDVSSIGLEPGEIDCNPDGTATLPIRATITNNTPEAFIAFLEPGTNPNGALDPLNATNSIGITSGSTVIIEVNCRYPTPSTPKPFLRFFKFNNEPSDCPDFFLPFGLIEKCACPEVENLVVNVEKCTAKFVGEFSAVEGCSFTWDFGDGTNEVITTIPEVSHSYQNTGVFAVAVTANCPNCVGISTIPVTIDDCVSPPVGACCLPENLCEILTEEECRIKGGQYKGDGTDCILCKVPPPCGKPTDALALVQAILLAGLMIVSFLKFCMNVPIPTELYIAIAVVGFAGTLVWGVYESMCLLGVIEPECCFNKCDRLYMSWIPLVTTGIIAFYVGGCCGNWWLGLSTALLVSGIGLFSWWVASCRPSKCEIYLAWLLVTVSAIGASFGLLEGLLELSSWLDDFKEALKLCLRPWIRISILVLGAFLAWKVRECINKPDAVPGGDVAI